MAISKSEKIKKQEIPPLLNAPLVETIFELNWDLQADPETGRLRDPSYPMMYGRLYERLKKTFPFIEDLPSNQVHPEMNPYVVRHRIRKEKGGYPLIQVGPGILTLNEGRGYSWSPFRAVAAKLAESIIEAFPTEPFPLNFIKSELRFVNGIPFDAMKESPLSFLADKLHMKIEMDPDLVANNAVQELPQGVALNLSYALTQPLGNLVLSVNMGHVDGRSAYIVQIVIQSFGETAPCDAESFASWFDDAHQTAENCFLALCKGSLMKTFGGAG